MSVIPWPKFTKEKKEYVSLLSDVITTAGVSPTQYVKFDIAKLVAYLSDLETKGNVSVDVHIGVMTHEEANKINIIFTAAGATEKDPKGTSAYNLGNAWP